MYLVRENSSPPEAYGWDITPDLLAISIQVPRTVKAKLVQPGTRTDGSNRPKVVWHDGCGGVRVDQRFIQTGLRC